jgi:gamma-glutamyltranspeptidase/glutathione hydrolase
VLASLGGGGFLLASLPDRGTRLFDFFAQTPQQPAPDARLYPIRADFGPASQVFHIGLGAAAVPGVPAGLAAAARWGGRLPLRHLLAPACRAARDGVVTNGFQSYIFDIVRPIFEASEGARAIFAPQSVAAGGVLRQPELAVTLERLGREGPDPLYRGDLAAALVDTCAREGGHLRREDLVGYQVIERQPLEFEFRGHRVLTNPPPSAGGVLIRHTLSLLESLAADAGPAMLAGALGLTSERRAAILAGGTTEATLDSDLETLARLQVSRGTTHISVVDGQGGAAALTLSNGEGCGHLVPGTGVMLNNMLGEEDINPDGVGRWPPATRLGSMMAPTLLRRGADLWALGSGGSNRIRSAIVQVLAHLTAGNGDALAAVRAPRLHVENALVSFEPGFETDAFESLGGFELHPWGEANLFFGGVHLAGRCNNAYVAVGDPRRGGHGILMG